jgi:hypothetical protein
MAVWIVHNICLLFCVVEIELCFHVEVVACMQLQGLYIRNRISEELANSFLLLYATARTVYQEPYLRRTGQLILVAVCNCKDCISGAVSQKNWSAHSCCLYTTAKTVYQEPYLRRTGQLILVAVCNCKDCISGAVSQKNWPAHSVTAYSRVMLQRDVTRTYRPLAQCCAPEL